MDSAATIHEIETAYAAYSTAFNAHDIASVVRYITAPYVMIIGNNPPMIAGTAELVRKQFDGALQGMLSRGWKRSAWKVSKVILLSDNHGLLQSDIVRYKADESVLETGRYLYTMRRAAPSWQITGVTDVAPPYLGPGDVPRSV